MIGAAVEQALEAASARRLGNAYSFTSALQLKREPLGGAADITTTRVERRQVSMDTDRVHFRRCL